MKSIMKWAGILAIALAVLTLAAMLTLSILGEGRLRQTYQIRDEFVRLPAGKSSLAEGRRIFRFRGCEACHGEQLEGKVYLDSPAIGQVITPNLTRGEGGIGTERADADWVRSVRHGVRPDGTALLFMPSTEFYFLSDADLGSVIAYIKSAHAVDNQMPPSQLSFTGRVVMNIAQEITFLPAELIPHDAPRPDTPAPGGTAQYGEYLTYSCKVCHGPGLSGGEIPGFPPDWPAAPNLTFASDSRLPGWAEQDFIQLIRTGRKHAHAINPKYMPWESYRFMTDEELGAVYAYLESLPPTEFGNR